MSAKKDMQNSIVNLKVTPQKNNPAFLHTLEDLIGETNTQKNSQFEDWKLLGTLQDKPKHFKITKFIHRKTNNIYALKCFEQYVDYEEEKQQIKKVFKQLDQKVNSLICTPADQDDNEKILFYEIGDCSLKELNDVMKSEECFWFEPSLFPQFNFILVTCYRILKYFLDNAIFPQNISQETIQLFKVGPRGDLRPKFMDIFQIDPFKHKESILDRTPQGEGDESKLINSQRISYKQLGLALLDTMYSSVIALEQQRRKVFYIDCKDTDSYSYPHISEQAKIEKVQRYFGGDEKDTKLNPYEVQAQQDAVEFIRCLIQRGNKYELDAIFAKLEKFITPLLDVNGFQRKVTIQQTVQTYKKIQKVPESQIIDDLELYKELELVECGQQLLMKLESAGIKLYNHPNYVIYKLKYYHIMGQQKAFDAYARKCQKNMETEADEEQKTEQDYWYEYLLSFSDITEDEDRNNIFKVTEGYFKRNYGGQSSQFLRAMLYQVHWYYSQQLHKECLAILEPLCQAISSTDNIDYDFQNCRLECFYYFVRVCLHLNKTNKKDLMIIYLTKAEDTIKKIMLQKTAIHGDIKFAHSLYVLEISRDSQQAKKMMYESMQLYKNSIGKKSFKYQDVLQQLCSCLIREKQHLDALPFIEENVGILQTIQLHNETCQNRFQQAKEKLYDIYLQTGKGHDHLLDVWLTQGQHYADVKNYDEALQYMTIGKWLIDKDYSMKLRKKSPGIIYVPSYEIDIRTRLVEIRKSKDSCEALDEQISLFEEGLNMCVNFYEDRSHDKQTTSLQYFANQYFYFSVELCKLILRKLETVIDNDYINQLWERAGFYLSDPFGIYKGDRFKTDTVNVFRGVCQKQEMNSHKFGNKQHVEKNKVQAMIIQRYEKVILKISRPVFLHDLHKNNSDYIPNTNLHIFGNLSQISKTQSLQSSIHQSQHGNYDQLSQSAVQNNQSSTICTIF